MTEPRPSLADPGVLIATVGGIGWLPKAPGTWGSLAALVPGWLIVDLGGIQALAGCIIAVFLAGIWACDRYSNVTATHDAGACVIDEVVGQWIVLLVVPLDPWLYVAAFAAFRLFDITKPWPASWADRAVPGGLGVMLDDVFAGIQGAAVIGGALLVIGMSS